MRDRTADGEWVSSRVMSWRGGRRRRWTIPAATAAAVVLAALLAACGGGTSGRQTSASTSAARPGSVGASSGPSTAAGAGVTSGRAENLTLTAAVRAQLLAAGAALHGLPTSDYSGLSPGTTYYARAPRTGDYWAGAGLVPRPGSTEAQVGNQDDGAFLIFTRSAGGDWHGWETGVAGGPAGGPCPVTIPAAVLAAWGWPSGTCHPPAGGEAASTAGPSSGATTAPPCTGSQITAKLTGTPSTQSQYKLVLELTNRSSVACTMTGFPGFELVGPVSDGSTTYDPVRQQVSYQTVTVPAGGAAHADFFALPGPDSCDAGRAWVPTSVTVTVPGETSSSSVAWPGGSVDNCQGGATHPGTYIGPVQAGA